MGRRLSTCVLGLAAATLLGGATRSAAAGPPGGEASSSAGEAVLPAGSAAQIDALFAPVAGTGLPGAAVLVLRKGEVVYAKGYGLADLGKGTPNTPHTRFQLASMSKSVTALLVLQLVEQGRLRLEDPLEKYLPGVVGGERITIHHLLSHTAGMPDFMGFAEAARLPRDCAPGERLNYSNLGYVALGRVIEKVTGKSYEQQLREAMLEPLGLHETGVDRPALVSGDRASGYLFRPEGGVVPADRNDLSVEPAAGGLFSTVADLGIWVKDLLAGRIVSAQTLEKAWTQVRLTDGRRGAYGYGFMLTDYRGLREAGHGGDISGFNSYLAIYPEERLAIVVLSNLGMRPPGALPTAGDLAHRILTVLEGDRLGPEWPETVDLAPAVLDRYVGRYRLEAPAPVAAVMGEAIEITREGGRLVASGQQGRAEIFPQSETAFFSKEGPIQIVFSREGGARAASAVLTLMGLREFRLTRLP